MNNMLIRKIRTLAHKECCNFIDGKCIEDRECAVINSRYPTMIRYNKLRKKKET